MRSPLSLAVLAMATVILAGCGQREAPQASAEPPPDKPAPGVVDDETLQQMLARTMNRFAKLDLNGDGKLSQEELNAATDGGDPTADEVQEPRSGHSVRAFERADTNGDGVVTRKEAEDQARERFKSLDADSNGRISHDELAAALSNTAKARPAVDK